MRQIQDRAFYLGKAVKKAELLENGSAEARQEARSEWIEFRNSLSSRERTIAEGSFNAGYRWA